MKETETRARGEPHARAPLLRSVDAVRRSSHISTTSQISLFRPSYLTPTAGTDSHPHPIANCGKQTRDRGNPSTPLRSASPSLTSPGTCRVPLRGVKRPARAPTESREILGNRKWARWPLPPPCPSAILRGSNLDKCRPIHTMSSARSRTTTLASTSGRAVRGRVS